ncbi:uncharacterized protein CC84DRAFT_359467 [Paraphaeosphaeria sporulosa]|uniref:Uncharacterized protein n=1 Tax=Paraphaeosphaeria sporulosa TaxID=1460663 RepID=A0A177BZT4_9PLEO|nr:uncharacterized protein CC84DRAFT_359467 [Paraphaeosphaeria sporulosa]OAG00102.1 hypothetical protein CC84DRAFT_359467 [Paraphaeosphaeria sporulosa]
MPLHMACANSSARLLARTRCILFSLVCRWTLFLRLLWERVQWRVILILPRSIVVFAEIYYKSIGRKPRAYEHRHFWLD